MVMTEEQVKQLIEALSSAQWNLDYYQFCDVLGVPQDQREHTYWQDKFFHLRELTSAINKFNAEALCKLANYKTLQPVQAA
jgi:hypothetical protein